MSRVLHRSRRFGMHWLTKSTHSHPNSSCKYHMRTASSSAHVAFVGLGNMGLPMALNLARNRPTELDISHLTVHDLHPPNMAKFMQLAREEGLGETPTTYSTAQTLAEVSSANPDFIVTSLPTCEASESVVKTIMEHSSQNQDQSLKIIDTSTVSVSTSRKLHDLASSSPQKDYIDAPVSGGVKGATDTTLTFMVGCSSPETFTSIQPLLQKMGQSIIPCGAPGSGTAVKLCNNAALAAQMVGICEAMNLGEALGVDPKVLAGVVNVSTAKCWSSQVNNPHPVAARDIGSGASAKDYEGGFGCALMLKDLNLAMAEAGGQGLAMPVSGLTRDLYNKIVGAYGAKDFGIMLQYLKDMQ